MFSTRHCLLLVDANRLAACRWRSGVLHAEDKFPNNDEGVAAFAAYLERHRDNLYYMLADVAEEGFQLELIPFVQGADRKLLIQRKLNQFFYGSTLAAGVSLGREKTGRRDERMLLTALTRAQTFEPWLKALRTAQAQLAGIYSVPLLVPALADRLKFSIDRYLMVSIGRAGIRQTFIDGGKLRFSRLSPVTATGTDDLARACAAESVRTYQYLSQRLIARTASLPVAVLVHPAERNAFAAACVDSDELQFEFIDLLDVARICGLRSTLQDSTADGLFLHLLARQVPREQFAAPAERRMYRLWQARSALKAAGAVALFGCLLFAANEMVEIAGLKKHTFDLLAQAENDTQRHAAVMKSLPPMPTSLENLRAVVGRYNALAQRSAPPGRMLARISAALEASPQVDVERIDWSLTTQPDEQGEADLRRASASSVAAANPGAMHAVAVLTGTLPALGTGDQRALLNAVNDFVAVLRRDPNLRVSVLRMPLDIESAKTLRSGSESAVTPTLPRFSLRIGQVLEAPPR